MWKSKKFIVAAVLVAVFLVAGTAGVVLAQDENQGAGPHQTLLIRVAQILGIDQQKLTDAFEQARTESRAEMLANLVKDGKITQAQADALKAWEAARPDPKADKAAVEAWLKARPDIPALKPTRPNMDEMLANLVKDGKLTQQQVDEFNAWMKAKPEMPNVNPREFKKLLDEGKITQQQIDAFKDWMKARPELPFPKNDKFNGQRPGFGPKCGPPGEGAPESLVPPLAGP